MPVEPIRKCGRNELGDFKSPGFDLGANTSQIHTTEG